LRLAHACIQRRQGGSLLQGTDDLLSGVREEFEENEDLPNTTSPDDWAEIEA